MRRLLLRLSGSGDRAEEALLVEGPLPSLSARAQQVLAALRRAPLYPLELARQLKISPQLAYYHISRLRRLGLIKGVEQGRVRGAKYTKYAPSASYLVWRLAPSAPGHALLRFFKEFIHDGAFSGLIVVGSPDPHGPFKSIARDGHYAAALAMALGGLCSPPSRFPVRLDVEVRGRELERENLVLIGGPGVNLLTMDLNAHLPIRFQEKNFWAGLSAGERTVFGEDIGLIAKIPNPREPSRRVIVLAGVRSPGTKAAVVALMRRPEEVLQGYEGEPFAALVRGYDLDGDGEVDDAEPLRI